MTDLDGQARTGQAVSGAERVHRARLQVAAHSTGPAECEAFLDMLGLLPGQPEPQLSDASTRRVPKHIRRKEATTP